MWFLKCCTKLGIPNSSQSPDIEQNSGGGNSDFWMSGQSLRKENYHNFRTSDDIGIKLEPVAKLDKSNKATSKIFDDDVISANFNVIIIFTIYGQFGAYRKLDSRCIVIFINSNLLPYKN